MKIEQNRPLVLWHLLISRFAFWKWGVRRQTAFALAHVPIIVYAAFIFFFDFFSMFAPLLVVNAFYIHFLTEFSRHTMKCARIISFITTVFLSYAFGEYVRMTIRDMVEAGDMDAYMNLPYLDSDNKPSLRLMCIILGCLTLHSFVQCSSFDDIIKKKEKKLTIRQKKLKFAAKKREQRRRLRRGGRLYVSK